MLYIESYVKVITIGGGSMNVVSMIREVNGMTEEEIRVLLHYMKAILSE